MNFTPSNWALIGLGFISSRHWQAIEAVGGKILATCDIDPAKKPDFTNVIELINSPIWSKISHVAICTPNYTHNRIAMMMSDKKVLIEKPMSLDSNVNFDSKARVVLQLRYHPAIKLLKKTLRGKHDARIVVRVKRDQAYWDSWKGNEQLSGGILMNLGIHYFDLLVYLFGNKYKVINSKYNLKKAEGTLDFKGTKVDYYIEILPDDKDQERYLEIDGSKVTLSNLDNLSYEDLHIEVYKAFMSGKGTRWHQAIESIRLVEYLKYGI